MLPSFTGGAVLKDGAALVGGAERPAQPPQASRGTQGAGSRWVPRTPTMPPSHPNAPPHPDQLLAGAPDSSAAVAALPDQSRRDKSDSSAAVARCRLTADGPTPSQVRDARARGAARGKPEGASADGAGQRPGDSAGGAHTAGAVLKDGMPPSPAGEPNAPAGVRAWLPACLGGEGSGDASPVVSGEHSAPASAESRASGSHAAGSLLEAANRLQSQAHAELDQARVQAERLRGEAERRLAEVAEVATTVAAARAVLEQARAEAAAVRAQAEAQARTVLEAARAEGYAAGERAGHAAGVAAACAALDAALERAHSVAAAAQVERARLVSSAEEETIHLALEIARTIIAKEVTADPGVLPGLLTRAMLKVPGHDRISLRLHPATITLLGDALTEVTARFASRGVEVIADPAVDETGVLVDSRVGRVDAGVETQLTRIGDALLDLAGAG